MGVLGNSLLPHITYGGVSAGFEDSFTDTDGVNITVHVPDVDSSGNGWSANMGAWLISGNEIVTNADMAVHIATCDVGLADCTVQASVNYVINTDDEPIGLVVRGDDDLSNYWLVVLDPLNSLLKIIKQEAFQPPSVEASTPITGDFQDNTYYVVRAVCSDARITAHCVLGATEDSVYKESEWQKTETRHGLYGFCRIGFDFQSFDDFSIEG